jgi:MFS family permease
MQDQSITPSLDEAVIRRSMLMSTLEGAATMVFIAWTMGSVLTGYSLHLGADAGAIALISSIPLIGQVLAPMVAWLASRATRRKPLITFFAVSGRSIWLVAVILPWLAPELRIPMLLGLLGFSSVLQSAGGPLWMAWMGDLVPAKERGRYFTVRGGIHGFVAMLANLAAGALLDALPSPLDFQIAFFVAVVAAMIGAFLLRFQAEPPVTPNPLTLEATLFDPLRDQTFRRFVVFAAYWSFSVMIGATFVMPYFLQHLKMSFTQVALWSVISAVFGLLFSPMWGRITSTYGNRPVLQLTTFLCGTLLPLTWMLASPGNLIPIWISGIVDAFVWSAINPSYFNLALSSTTSANRTAFTAMLGAITGVTGFAAALLSGVLLNAFGGLEFKVGSFEWSQYLVSGLLRIQAWQLLRRIDEPGAWRLRDTAKRLGRSKII